MKRAAAIAIILTLSMMLSATGPALAERATASVQGSFETVTVTLEVTDGVITDASAESDMNDSEEGAQALKELPEAMVAGNTLKVDGISGATLTSDAIIAAATDAYLHILGEELDLDAWARGNGYLKAGDYNMQIEADATSSATVTGEGGVNFGDIELSDALKRALALEYLKGAEGNYREMYQIATACNNTPTIGSVEFVLDPADMSLFGSSESNTAKLSNMEGNPRVDLYWTRQIREGDTCSDAMPVLPSYFMSYGVEITGAYRAVRFAELDEAELPMYLAKARAYFATLAATAQLAEMDDTALYEYLCASPMNFYQIVPSRYVITSPWFLNVYDSGYARRFVSEDLQASLADAVKAQYPEAEALTLLDYATLTATGLRTQQVLNLP